MAGVSVHLSAGLGLLTRGHALRPGLLGVTTVSPSVEYPSRNLGACRVAHNRRGEPGENQMLLRASEHALGVRDARADQSFPCGASNEEPVRLARIKVTNGDRAVEVTATL